ncbi:MAG TPA: DUF2877 domain-containing protein [bacterium]|nr:DUF2877 domain-containing protein [bacterium]
MTPASTVLSLRAESASATILEFLHTPHTGRVIATFARSCYLALDRRIVALVSAELHNGPLNVVVTPAPPFGDLSTGAPASSNGHRIQVIDVWDTSLDGATAWDPILRRIDHTARGVPDNHLQVLTDLIAAEAPAGGLARLSVDRAGGVLTPLERTASLGLRNLLTGLGRANRAQVVLGAHALAGLGPGLTPSGDDVLVGCLLALAALPDARGASLREAIASSARHRTTQISTAYLEAAARGEASEAWHRLIAAMGTSDAVRVVGAARHVLAVGETSGSDMLGGFILASRAVLDVPAPTAAVRHSMGMSHAQ